MYIRIFNFDPFAEQSLERKKRVALEDRESLEEPQDTIYFFNEVRQQLVRLEINSTGIAKYIKGDYGGYFKVKLTIKTPNNIIIRSEIQEFYWNPKTENVFSILYLLTDRETRCTKDQFLTIKAELFVSGITASISSRIKYLDFQCGE